MDRHGIEAFLEELTGDKGHDLAWPWITVSCPLAQWTHENGEDNNPSFGVKVNESGKSRCYCFSCGHASDLEELVLEIRARTGGMFGKKKAGHDFARLMKLAEEDEGPVVLALSDPSCLAEETRHKSFHVFPEDWVESFPKAKLHSIARGYLKDRGVSDEVSDRVGFRWDSNQKRVCAPIRMKDGRCVGFHGRTVSGEINPKWRMYKNKGRNNPDAVLGEEWVDWDSPVVVTESVFDMTSAMRVHENTISVLTASVSAGKTRRLRQGMFFVTAFDGDKAGRAGRKRLETMLPKAVFRHVDLPEGRDLNSLDEDEIHDLFRNFLPDLS